MHNALRMVRCFLCCAAASLLAPLLSTIHLRRQTANFEQSHLLAMGGNLPASRHYALPMRPSILLALLGASISTPCLSQGAAPMVEEVTPLSENSVVLRRRLNTNYAGQPFLALLPQVQATPSRSVVVAPGETISGLIAREYSVSQPAATDTYRAFRDAIVAQNKLLSADKLIAGQVLSVPDVPKATDPTQKSILKTKALKCREVLGQMKCSWQTLGIRVPVNPIFIQRKEVSDEESSKILAIEGSGWEIESRLVDIQFAADAGSKPSRFLSSREESALHEFFKRPPLQRVPLFVLDDVWPDGQSFIDSKAFLFDAARLIRVKYQMGPSALAPALAMRQFVTSDEQAASGSHARSIKHAIAPLTDLDPTFTHVRPVYLPLFRLQSPADDVLIELTTIHLMARDMGPTLGYQEVPEDIRKKALKNARAYVQRISNKKERTTSDQIVVESLVWFARHWSIVAQQPFLMNFSWTVPNLSQNLSLPTDAFGLVVVAAGNDRRLVAASKVQLAYRSVFPRDVLAVMNVDTTGTPDCSSSLLDIDGQSTVVSFGGQVSDTTCGTSFAAPRVAWLIAARAAGRKVDPAKNWTRDLLIELGSLYDASRDNYNKIRFDVVRFYNKEVPNAENK